MIGRRQIAISATVAFLLECLLLVLFAVRLATGAVAAAVAVEAPEPAAGEENPAPDQIVILTPVASPVMPVPPKKKEVLNFQLVDTNPAQTQGKPERPTDLISDRSTRAASEISKNDPNLPARPTQDGIAAPGLDLENQNFHDGEQPGAAGKPGAPGPLAKASPGAAAPAVPETRAKPVEHQEKPAQPAEPVARADAIELLELPGGMPRIAVPKPQELLRPRPEATVAKESTAVPPRPPAGSGGGGGEQGFQSRKIKRAMEGTLSQRGRASMDVDDTPLGRYLATVSRVIERDWQRSCGVHRDMITPGFLRVNFTVAPDGRVLAASEVENEACSAASKSFTLKSVQGAKLPPIPKEVVEMLENGRLEVNFNFLFFQ